MAETPSSDPRRMADVTTWNAAVIGYEDAIRHAAACAPGSTDELAGLQRAEAAWALLRQLERQWMDALPEVTVSICPFCETPLRQVMDIHGLEGPWWRPEALRPAPTGCHHFCVLRGAVAHHHQPIPRLPFEIRPGPEVPYLLPSLLALPGMVAVVGSVRLCDGRESFPIAYFSPTLPPERQLSAHWPGALHVLPGTDGAACWKQADEHWEFDLAPWHARGQLRWCLPGSRNAVLNGDGDPFIEVDAQGLRCQIVLHGQDVAVFAAP